MREARLYTPVHVCARGTPVHACPRALLRPLERLLARPRAPRFAGRTDGPQTTNGEELLVATT
ncbi:hypothetical protein CU044_2390 [Streptomyces sp. L-9-10]|nr:hypothetical protein CU044_2390 [Streptomyces sp. L-9-10]